MSEKAILFSGPMVRTILEGRKTQTRRVAKLNYAGRVQLGGKQWHVEDPNAILACPYGQLGDRLWVRETFRDCDDGDLYFRADFADGSDPVNADLYEGKWRWKPAIFMPRKLSRITLEITDVRVQRLQDISIQDLQAEGMNARPRRKAEHLFSAAKRMQDSMEADYRLLWESINGFESWDANPWVWAITFKRVDGGPR